jgi:hypothetical protein
MNKKKIIFYLLYIQNQQLIAFAEITLNIICNKTLILTTYK